MNSASADSLTIANHYIDLRQIPSSNVLYLEWRGDLNTIDVQTFRNQILGPTLQAMEARELGPHIDGILYSSDFPYNVDFTSDVPEADRPRLTPQMTPIGSLNSLTFYYAFVLNKQPLYVSYKNATNLYYRPIEDGRQTAETRGFRGWYGWARNGEPMEAGGTRYLLSAFLGLTTGRGNSPAEVVRYLRRSAGADGTQPRGTIYFSTKDDPRTRTRTEPPWFQPSIADLKNLGLNVELIDTSAPESKKDVAGAMLGDAGLNWRTSKSTILPGAIVDNLTSFGAEMPKVNGHTLLTELLAAGAAGSSGTAVEPWTVPHKFASPYVFVHYARGCNLIESYYQSVAAPYQLVIAGDALCRPWAKIPEIRATGVAAEDALEGVVSITPSADGGEANVDRFELYMDGLRVATCSQGEKLTLDTRPESDGFHELRIVGIDAGPIATQGRLIVPVTFKNHGLGIKLSASATRVRAREKIKLTADAPGAGGILFYSNGRQWNVNGPKGTIALDTNDLGTGPVVFRAIGMGSKGKASHVIAEPVTVQIDPLR